MKEFKDLKVGDYIYEIAGIKLWKNRIFKIDTFEDTIRFYTIDQYGSSGFLCIGTYFLNKSTYENCSTNLVDILKML